MKVKAYIAGPYSGPDVCENVRNAIMTSDLLIDAGLAPFCPHLMHYQNIITPRSYQEWMSQCFEWISVCNCLIRLPGDSPGADQEVDYAKQCGLRIYYHLHDCIAAESIPNLNLCEGGP